MQLKTSSGRINKYLRADSGKLVVGWDSHDDITRAGAEFAWWVQPTERHWSS